MDLGVTEHGLQNTTAFSATWRFMPVDIYMNNESTVGEAFVGDNVVAILLREYFQNLLDAGSNAVRFLFASLGPENIKALDIAQIEERAKGCTSGQGKRDIKLKKNDDGSVRCLICTDNGKGLGGNIDRAPGKAKPGGYQAFANGYGNSSKDSTENGSKGMGRATYFRASELMTIAVLSRREEDGLDIAFGLSELRIHDYRGEEYQGYGHFLRDLTHQKPAACPPMVGEEAVRFGREIGMEVDGDHGTAMCIVSVRDEFTVKAIISEIIANHFVPVIANGIKVEVGDENGLHVIDPDTILDYAANAAFGGNDNLVETIRTVMTLYRDMQRNSEDIGYVSGRFNHDVLDEDVFLRLAERYDNEESVAVTATFFPVKTPRNKQSGKIHFGVRHNPRMKHGLMIHMRERLPTVTLLLNNPHVIMVLCAGDDVSRMLRAGEDATHTKWFGQRMHEAGWPKQNSYDIAASFSNGGLELLKALNSRGVVEDTSIFASVFPMTAEESSRRNVNEKDQVGDNEGDGDDNESGQPNPPILQGFVVPKDDSGHWGFGLRLTEAGRNAFRSGMLDRPIDVAVFHSLMDKTQGASVKHSKADFDFADISIEAKSCGFEVTGPNILRLSVYNDNFEIRARGGFDPNRGLQVGVVEA